MPKFCCFNGKIKELQKAGISLYDLGILRGYAVFDVMRTVNGKPFLAKEHFLRLKKSAEKLKLKTPFSFAEFERNIKKLLKINKLAQATIRTLITGGVSADSFSIGEKPTSFIIAEKFHSFSEKAIKNGAKLILLENKIQYPQAKTTLNYLAAIGAQKEKNKNKAHEILYVSGGRISECSTSNFFIMKDGVIITPKENVLHGITRDLIIKLARGKYKIEEREIWEDEIYGADEVFFTATSKGVVPVTRIGNKKAGRGKIGPVTKKLSEIYEKYLKKY